MQNIPDEEALVSAIPEVTSAKYTEYLGAPSESINVFEELAEI